MANCHACTHHSAMHTAGRSEETCDAGKWLHPKGKCAPFTRRIPWGHVVPFSNGAEFDAWTRWNCHGCKKGNPTAMSFEEMGCPMERALAEGAILSTVPLKLARRAGWDQRTHEMGECPEKVE